MATAITATAAYTDIRGGGYGGSAWIAKVTGTDSKYGFARQFCKKDKSGLSGSGKSGLLAFEMQGDGVYEFRGFCVGSTANNWEWSGFMLVENGQATEISRERAMELAKALGKPARYDGEGICVRCGKHGARWNSGAGNYLCYRDWDNYY